MAVTGSYREKPSCLACPSCDLIFDVSTLTKGDSAHCSRCGHCLTIHRKDAFQRAIAYGISGLILLALACSFPFMSFKVSGLESAMTLPQVAFQLWIYDMPELSVLVAAFIIIIPAFVLCLLLLLASALLFNRHGPWLPTSWLPTLGRMIFTLQNWCMVEVFFIGVLVSLVKIAKMATLVMGISFWAYGAFSLLFILALSSLDRAHCWQRIEALSLGKLSVRSSGAESLGSS